MITSGGKYLVPTGPNEAIERYHGKRNLWVAFIV